MRDRLIDVFTHLDEHISYKEEYGILFDTPFVKAVEDVLQMLNGVTVQEWISVKDRLPEPFVSVLVQMPDEAPHPTVREGFITRDGIWHSALYDREPDEVTHWQPMPQPPKGE